MNFLKHILSRIVGGIKPEKEESEDFRKKQKEHNEILRLENIKKEKEQELEISKLKQELQVLRNAIENKTKKNERKEVSKKIRYIEKELDNLGDNDDLLGKNSKIENFRLNSKKILVTYSMDNNKLSNYAPEDFVKFLYKKFSSNMHWCIIAFERSEITNYEHTHIYIQLLSKCDIKNPRRLDIDGVHGRYETVKNVESTIAYITKTENFKIFSGKNEDSVEYLTNKQMLGIISKYLGKYFSKTCNIGTKSIRENIYKLICSNKDIKNYKKQITEIFDKYLENKYISIKDWVLFFDIISNMKDIENLDRLNNDKQDYEKPIYIHRKLLITIYIWARLYTNKYGKPISFGLQGQPGTFKTSVITHMGGNDMIVIQHNDKLKLYDKRKHLFLLYDDIDLKGKSREEIIHLLDSEQEYQANVKNSMQVVDKSTIRIITTNKDFKELFNSKDKAIARRIMKTKLYNRIEEEEYDKDNYSDVFDGILLYIKSRVSWYYNVYIDISNYDIIMTDLDKCNKENYIKVNYGTLKMWIEDNESLKRVICGSLYDKHDKELEIAFNIYKQQIKRGSKLLEIEDMLEIIKIVKKPVCICNSSKTDKSITCFVHRYFLRYLKKGNNLYESPIQYEVI